MSEAKQELVQQAKFALKAERYEDMVAAMKKVIETSAELSNEEQDLLSVAYKRVVCARLSAWYVIRSIEQKTEGSEKRQQLAKEYREKIEMELKQICGDVLGLLDNILVPKATTPKSQMFYGMMKIEYAAYLAEIGSGDGKSVSPASDAVSPPPQAPPSTAQINDLKDADLAMIFELLPPFERLIVSEVCSRWRDLSRSSWLDVATLDLTKVPGPNIAAVVRQCPNLQSVVYGLWKFAYKRLHLLSRLPLSSVKLYDGTARVPGTGGRIADAYSAIFSTDLQVAAWDDLVLHDVSFEREPPGQIDFPASLPRSLKRLQLSGSFATEQQMLREYASDPSARFLRGLDELRELECLMLLGNCSVFLFERTPTLLQLVSQLRNLRELCIGPLRFLDFAADYTLLPKNLPRLEVLFLHEPSKELTANFLEGIPRLSMLRILVITGSVTNGAPSIECPVRKMYPDGFGSDPLPLLHVFLDKKAFAEINFAGQSDAMKVHRIDARLSQFLEREDIAPLFDRVWIAQQIKETAKRSYLFLSEEEFFDQITLKPK